MRRTLRLPPLQLSDHRPHQGRPQQAKLLCRTFSDCTTAPRNGLPSGCYPLDDYYKSSDLHARLKEVKGKKRS